MPCPNCHIFHHLCKASCCGVVPFDKNLFEIFKDKFQRPVTEMLDMEDGDVIPMTEGGTCVFLQKDLRCAIYEHRPEVCQKFGSEEDLHLTCMFQRKNGESRSFFERKHISKQQHKLIQKKIQKMKEKA